LHHPEALLASGTEHSIESVAGNLFAIMLSVPSAPFSEELADETSGNQREPFGSSLAEECAIPDGVSTHWASCESSHHILTPLSSTDTTDYLSLKSGPVRRKLPEVDEVPQGQQEAVHLPPAPVDAKAEWRNRKNEARRARRGLLNAMAAFQTKSTEHALGMCSSDCRVCSA
jgi:hypothetical protein